MLHIGRGHYFQWSEQHELQLWGTSDFLPGCVTKFISFKADLHNPSSGVWFSVEARLLQTKRGNTCTQSWVFNLRFTLKFDILLDNRHAISWVGLGSGLPTHVGMNVSVNGCLSLCLICPGLCICAPHLSPYGSWEKLQPPRAPYKDKQTRKDGWIP